MPEVVEMIKTQVGVLSKEERAELAHFFLLSLEPEEEEADVASAWDVEVKRRQADFQSGKATARPIEDVFIELRKRHS